MEEGRSGKRSWRESVGAQTWRVVESKHCAPACPAAQVIEHDLEFMQLLLRVCLQLREARIWIEFHI